MIRTIEELESLFDSYAPSMQDGRIRERRLDRMRMLLDRIGHPEKSYRTYHAAGSKGKGTTCAYLASLLSASGRKCGLYSSPHMYSVRERFTLSSSFFSDRLYVDTANELISLTKDFRIPPELGAEQPTTFEMYTAYGYLLFERCGCTDAVIETGLGGRLDATNTIEPEAVFLTPVELEHTAVLGHTVREIAGEKSKIIRPGVPVFVSKQTQEARDVFRKEAEAMHAPVHFLDEEISDFCSKTTTEGEDVRFTIDGSEFRLRLAMSTEAMAENAALAILGAKRMGFLTSGGLAAVESTELPGRFEKRIIDSRLVVIDASHTVNSAKAAADAFAAIVPGEKTLLYSSVEGKDVENIIKVLFPRFSRVVITSTGEYRKSNPEAIAEIAKRCFPSIPVTVEKDRDKALERALAEPYPVLVAGSFYLPSGMRRLREKENRT